MLKSKLSGEDAQEARDRANQPKTMLSKYGYDESREFSPYSQELDDYMSQLKSEYGNTPFWSEFTSNPYLTLGADPSMLGNISSEWLFDYLGTRKDSAMNHIKEIIQKIREQGYNEPIEQNARLRAAGINSDIAGNVDPNQATEGTELPQTGMPSAVDAQAKMGEIVSTIGNSVMSLFSTAVGFAGNVAGVVGQNIANRSAAVGYAEGLDKLVFDRLTDLMGVPDIKDGMSVEDFESEFGNTMLNAAQKIDYSGIPRQIRKDYQRYFNSYMTDAKTGKKTLRFKSEFYNKFKKYLDDRKGVAEHRGHPAFHDDDMKFFDDFAELVSNMEFSVWQSSQELIKEMNRFKGNVAYIGAEATSPLTGDSAYIENETQKYRSEQAADIASADARAAAAGTAETREQLNKVLEDSVKNVSDQFKGLVNWVKGSDMNSVLKGILLLGLPIIQSRVISHLRSMVNSGFQSPMDKVKDDAGILFNLM